MAQVPMAKVELIGPKNKFFEVVSLIHEQGKLHIEDLTKKISSGEVPLDKMEVVANQQAERDRMEDLLIRVRGIIKALHLPGVTIDEAKRQEEYLRLWKLDTGSLSDEVTEVVTEVEGKTSELANGRTALEGEIELLARYEPILQKVQPLAKQIVTTGAFDSVALLFERRYKGALDQLKAELDKITHKQCEIVSTDVDEDTTAAIVVFNRSYAEPVHKFLAMENVNQIRLPSDFQDMPFDMAYEVIKERRRALPEKLAAVRAEIEKMSETWYMRLATVRDVLTDKIDEIKAIPKFGQTDYAFVITGWIPVDEVKELKKALFEQFTDDIIVTQKEIDEHDFGDTPVALVNNPSVAPFAALFPTLRGGLPKYGTIDPTVLIALFYPIIFGMIVGDIGYGAVFLALIIWFRRKNKDNPFVQTATSILGPAATMSIAFGFLYGEFFGNIFGPAVLGWIKLIHIGPIVLPFERTIMVTEFMFVALAVGAIQMALGLVIGVINGVRTKHVKHVWEKGGILTFFIGFLLLIATAAVGVPGTLGKILQVVFALAVIGGLFYAIKGGGILGVIESMDSVTHMASYIRIMAVGLAGAIFAEAVNQMALTMGPIVGLIVGLLLHSLNFVLSVAFSPNIHALRLNFYEFFQTFYESGKQEYKPFQKTGGEENA